MLLLVFAPEKKEEAHGDKEKRPIGMPLSGNECMPLGEQKIATDERCAFVFSSLFSKSSIPLNFCSKVFISIRSCKQISSRNRSEVDECRMSVDKK